LLVNETDEYHARIEWTECAHKEKACTRAPQPFNKIHFYIEMIITGTISNGLNLDKCYSRHDPE